MAGGRRRARRYGLFALLAGIALVGCTAIEGLGGLREVICVGDCGPVAGDASAAEHAAPREDAPAASDSSDSSNSKDAGDASSADGHAGPTLIFDEEFDGGTLDIVAKWAAAGDGVWFIDAGVGVQSNPMTGKSVLYAQAFAAATDYRIVARMRSTGPFDADLDLAPEIAFRLDPSLDAGQIPATFHCNVDFLEDQIIIDETAPVGGGQIAEVPIPFPAGFDLSTPFVLEAVVSGDSVTCTVTFDGVGLVTTVSTPLLTRLTGSFGLKTYDTSADFFYFRVYSEP